MPSEYDILRSLLSDRPIAFHPQMARLFGGINEALLFQQLAYWTDKASNAPWVYKTMKDIEEEITLTRTQQENARRKLRSLGVIEEAKRGVPAKLYFRVVWEAVYELLEDAATKDAANLQSGPQDAGNLQSSMQETDLQDRGKAADQDAGDLPTITKSTQRTESEKPLEFRKANPQEYDEAREWLFPYVDDFAREFRDQAHRSSTMTRVAKLYRRSGLDEEAFVDLLYRARQTTKERTGSVRTGEGGKKNLMPYFLTVLERFVTDAA